MPLPISIKATSTFFLTSLVSLFVVNVHLIYLTFTRSTFMIWPLSRISSTKTTRYFSTTPFLKKYPSSSTSSPFGFWNQNWWVMYSVSLSFLTYSTPFITARTPFILLSISHEGSIAPPASRVSVFTLIIQGYFWPLSSWLYKYPSITVKDDFCFLWNRELLKDSPKSC